MSLKEDTTDFGFAQVPVGEKAGRVASIFHAVAEHYDLMNDLMSFGLHRLWKKFTLAKARIRPGQTVLDVAAGTGDLAAGFCRRLKGSGRVVLADINRSMLEKGRERLTNQGFLSGVQYVQADAEALPFQAETFDCISIAFGLRNVTQKPRALSSLYRVLKPGGHLLVLEFSKPVLPLLSSLYDRYSFHVIPALGQWVCGEADSYRYLVESIRQHPDQATLGEMLGAAGFSAVSWHNLSGGIVALHRGVREA